jgi:hypothetical protein
LLIGAVPPAAISDWRYLAVSLLAGMATPALNKGFRAEAGSKIPASARPVAQ